MFIILLATTFMIALIVSLIVIKIFDGPITKILERLINDNIYTAWKKYITFAICVVGISSGVKIWKLERYITETYKDSKIISLNTDRWIIEIYRTVVGALQGIAWLLLIFFIFTLIAYAIVRIRRENTNQNNL